MQEPKAILIVQRAGGLLRQSVWRSLAVMMDGHQMGVVGEEISIEQGTRTVTVKTPFVTCRPMQVELRSGSTTLLDYRSSWLALASVGLGLCLFMALSFPAIIFLEQLKVLVDGDLLPPGIGLLVLLAFLAFYGWVAFAAPLRILAAAGIHSHKLTVSTNID